MNKLFETISTINYNCCVIPLERKEEPAEYYQMLENQLEKVQSILDLLKSSVRAKQDDDVVCAATFLDVNVNTFKYITGHDMSGAMEMVVEDMQCDYSHDEKEITELAENMGHDVYEVTGIVVSPDGNEFEYSSYSIHDDNGNLVCLSTNESSFEQFVK